MAIIKVRATQDGHYGGYYRIGPVDSDQGYRPGEIFEVDDAPYEVKDEHGRPMPELDETGKPIPVMVGGKQKVNPETGRPMFKIKMASFFSKEWMERVSDDAEVTNDYPPFQQPSQYRIKKVKGQPKPTIVLPTVPVESPI